MLLLVWASSALLTRAHYSQDYSPDHGALRGRLVRCISVVLRKVKTWKSFLEHVAETNKIGLNLNQTGVVCNLTVWIIYYKVNSTSVSLMEPDRYYFHCYRT